MGLLALVVTILAGTTWTVGSFLESSAPIAQAAAPSTPEPGAVLAANAIDPPYADAADCNAHTLAPEPSWHSVTTIITEDVLRAEPVIESTPCRPVAGSSSGVLLWGEVSAPAETTTSG